MNSKTEKEVIHWRGIAIELRYVPEWSKVFTKTYGEPLAHLEFRTISPSEAPLPITETGYKSMFLMDSEIQEFGGAEKFARAVLDDAARDKNWQAYEEQARQLSLF